MRQNKAKAENSGKKDSKLKRIENHMQKNKIEVYFPLKMGALFSTKASAPSLFEYLLMKLVKSAFRPL
jgi:hypothetical protein